MSERDFVLASLIREALEPHGGSFEVLPSNHDPQNEYLTGVLAPRDSRHRPDIEAETELPYNSEPDVP